MNVIDNLKIDDIEVKGANGKQIVFEDIVVNSKQEEPESSKEPFKLDIQFDKERNLIHFNIAEGTYAPFNGTSMLLEKESGIREIITFDGVIKKAHLTLDLSFYKPMS